ncbi:threonine-phosphate decarboxylase CobD [Acerihabitans sp. TG2]|uniref:threonine-phosphate decarboxylase CobD n=1 Tax=Acerihabitans sp. TG2 TaxID=3096008 RepID=UPI002B22FF8F|nr:threonine-phosphate decarboxylase CobD [Acerihabitans sp. TG2]MEA9389347.1 threonine-phosphate decarboxylase CobD [Acerihabitans sp. TG2]
MDERGQHGGNVREMAQKWGLDETAILDFSANINPLGMPTSLKQAIVNRLDLAESYPDPEYQRLHARLAQHHHCPASWILAGNGATELIFDLASLLRHKTVLLLTPSFGEYRRALQWMDCRLEEYPLAEEDDFRPDTRLLAALRPGIDCVFLCTPNNPTGQLMETSLLLAIAQRCQELSIMLVVDEAFMDFIPDGVSLTDSLQRFSQVFVLRSLTKFYAIPGLRLGYMVSSNTTAMAQLRQRRPPWTLNAFAALAGEILLDDRDYQHATWRWLKQEQTTLTAGLRTIRQLRVWQPTANYIFFRCLRPALDLQAALLSPVVATGAAEVITLSPRPLIRRCANYPGLNGNFYRVAIKGPKDNQLLLHELQRVFSYG